MRNKKKKLGLLVLMLCAIVSSVAFAAYSGVLTISGTTSIQSNPFNVIFTDSSGSETGTVDAIVTKGGEATPTGSPVSLSSESTSFSGYSVQLFNPGDKIEYKFKIKNKGGEPAYLTSVEIASTTLSNWSDIKSDEFIYSVSLGSDDVNVKSVNGAIATNESPNFSIAADTSVDVTVSILWDSLEENSFPGVLDSISMGTITFNWSSQNPSA